MLYSNSCLTAWYSEFLPWQFISFKSPEKHLSSSCMVWAAVCKMKLWFGNEKQKSVRQAAQAETQVSGNRGRGAFSGATVGHFIIGTLQIRNNWLQSRFLSEKLIVTQLFKNPKDLVQQEVLLQHPKQLAMFAPILSQMNPVCTVLFYSLEQF